MDKLKVVCGILIWNDKILIGKRLKSNPNHGGMWEFPGGKIEEGETFDSAIVREFKEELDVDVYPFHQLRTLVDGNVEFTPMPVKLVGGKAKLIVHEEIKFVNKKEFFQMDLTPLTRKAGKILFESYNIFLRRGM